MTTSKATAKCPKCGLYVPINQLIRSMDDKPVLDFHSIPQFASGERKECPGSMRPFVEGRKWR